MNFWRYRVNYVTNLLTHAVKISVFPLEYESLSLSELSVSTSSLAVHFNQSVELGTNSQDDYEEATILLNF